MSVAEMTPPMTLEEMLALPGDDIERDLIEGRLRERPRTTRNRWHAGAEAKLARFLEQWAEALPEPLGQVVSGEAGFRIRRDPDTSFGIDVAFVSAEVIAATPAKSPYFEGPPVLAVEILSHSTTRGDMVEKIRAYLDAGVPLVWVVDPDLHAIVVHRPGAAPELFNIHHELSCDPRLPGFRVAVARVFGARPPA